MNREYVTTYTSGMVKGKFHAIDVATVEATLSMAVATDAIIDRWVTTDDHGDYVVTIVHSTPANYGTYVGIDGKRHNYDGSII